MTLNARFPRAAQRRDQGLFAETPTECGTGPLIDESQADARIKRACSRFLNGHTRRSVMTICPIALAVGCKRCPAFSVCPLKTVIGDYMKPGKPGSKQPSHTAKK
jgi:hypothetical protein